MKKKKVRHLGRFSDNLIGTIQAASFWEPVLYTNVTGERRARNILWVRAVRW